MGYKSAYMTAPLTTGSTCTNSILIYPKQNSFLSVNQFEAGHKPTSVMARIDTRKLLPWA